VSQDYKIVARILSLPAMNCSATVKHPIGMLCFQAPKGRSRLRRDALAPATDRGTIRDFSVLLSLYSVCHKFCPELWDTRIHRELPRPCDEGRILCRGVRRTPSWKEVPTQCQGVRRTPLQGGDAPMLLLSGTAEPDDLVESDKILGNRYISPAKVCAR